MISYRDYARIIVLILFTCLSSCAQSGADDSTSSNNRSQDITIDKSSIIPVLDGKSTTTGIYIHNTTNHDINGIRYDITSNDLNKLSLIKDSCIDIKANTSCFLRISTPTLELLNGGSSILLANYNSKQSSGFISYQYVDSRLYTGVTFGGASISLSGSQDYGTTYAFVGNNGLANNVSFKTSNDSISIVNGLSNGVVTIASNEIVALELMSGQDVTSAAVDITPVEALSNSMHIQNTLNNSLQVAIIPTTNPNLIMSIIPVLTPQTPTATVTVYNNGGSLAMNTTLVSSNSDIVVQDGPKPCNFVIQDNSCNYIVSLDTKSNSGSALLTLGYSSTYTKAVPVYYHNGRNVPIIGVMPTQTQLNQSVSESGQVRFDVAHFSGENLTSSSFQVVSKLPYSQAIIESNTCSSTLIQNMPCHVMVTITASNLIESGIVYLTLQGQASSKVYNFVSTPVNVSVVDVTIPTVTSTIPANNESGVSVATGISISFSEAMNPLTLNKNNIKLLRVSDATNIPLTVQSITNNNKKVNLTTGVQLAQGVEYKILINPNKILDANGTAINYSLSESSIAIFTTGVDNTSPTITNFKPDDGMIKVSKTPTMFIQFSESMDVASLNTSNIILATSLGEVFTNYQIYYEPSTYSAGLILINGGQLASNTEYQIKLNESAIKDLFDNALGISTNKVLTTFTTSDYVAPTILVVNPSDGATGVSESVTFSISFSESMDTSTLIAANIQLQGNKDSTNISLSSPTYSNGNRTVAFTPMTTLAEAESYSIIINPSEIKDVAGNPVDALLTTKVVSVFKAAGYGLVYVLPVPVNGDLGQESGADGKCQTAGSQLIDGSTWKALLAFNSAAEQDIKYYRFNPSTPPIYKGLFIGYGRQINPIYAVVPLSAPISETVTGSFWFGAMEVTYEGEQRISLIDRCYNMSSEKWWGTESNLAAGSVAKLNSTTPFQYTYPESPTVMCNESRYLACVYTNN